MPRRSARSRSAGGDAPQIKKTKHEIVNIDEIDVRFEWEGDGNKWIQYSKDLNKKIANAYVAKKKQIGIEVGSSIKMNILFPESVQKNKKTGFERRIRIAMKNNEDDEFKVIEWQGDDKDWNPYNISTSLELKKALNQSKKSLSTPIHDMDLTKMIQTNKSTKTTRKIREEFQDSDKPDDDEGSCEEEKEEEEEEEIKAPKSSGKSKSGKSTAKKNEAKSSVKTVVVKKGSAPVDSYCSIANKCSVYEAGGDIWDCMLNQTNIANNNNKFYLIQLLKTDGKQEYHCWQRWGRVGYDGQTNLVNCGSDLQSAQKVFEKKFNDKTGNPWGNRDSFAKRPGKYDLLKMDYSTEGNENMDSEMDSETTPGDDNGKEKEDVPDSKLDQKVQDLIQLICDIQTMEDQIVEMKYDTKKAPLGKLTKDQVKAGYTALKEIETLINKKDYGNNLKEACSDFYTRIPHEFGMQVPPLIRTPQDVKKKLQLLEALEDIEIAIKLLKGGDMSENPIDRHYHQLNCGLEPVDKSSETFKMLNDYLQKTHASTHMMYKMHLEDVFEVDRKIEAANFKDYGNRMLLWHGSRLTNWAGILGQGLRIAPPEAPVTGYMFGKGVYFADMSSKSANYCFATKARSTGVVVLCDVSLGTIDPKLHADPKAASLPFGKNSVKGQGMIGPDEKTFVTMPDGLVVPIGKETKTGVQKANSGYSLNYNEYIVYDISQIKMKYLLKVKFNFK